MFIYALILSLGTFLGTNHNKADEMGALGRLKSVEKSTHEVVADYESGKAKVQLFMPLS